jgi:hypothetical protein
LQLRAAFVWSKNSTSALAPVFASKYRNLSTLKNLSPSYLVLRLQDPHQTIPGANLVPERPQLRVPPSNGLRSVGPPDLRAMLTYPSPTKCPAGRDLHTTLHHYFTSISPC